MPAQATPLIYHMTPQAIWDAQRDAPEFVAASLADEGFIHCTAEPAMLLHVANRFYRDVPEPFIIVAIDGQRVHAEVRWEEADGHLFPHIYGPLNREAVVDVLPFPRLTDDRFMLPPALGA